MPSSVVIFRVTKFRPGEQTMTFASTIFIEPLLQPSASASSSIDTAGEKAAVDHQDLATHEAGGIGSEEDRRARQLFQPAVSIHRRSQEKLAPALGAVQKRLVEIGSKHAWRDGVDANAARAPLDGERFGERNHRGFARSVGGDFVESNERGELGDVDDRASPSLEHGA